MAARQIVELIDGIGDVGRPFACSLSQTAASQATSGTPARRPGPLANMTAAFTMMTR
jgi:hypothetical protein